MGILWQTTNYMSLQTQQKTAWLTHYRPV